MRHSPLSLAAFAAVCASGHAAGVRFVVVDAHGVPMKDAVVQLRSAFSIGASDGPLLASNSVVDLGSRRDEVVIVRFGETRTIAIQGEPPVKDIYVTVTAPRIRRAKSEVSNGTTRTKAEIQKFGGGSSGNVNQITKSSAGVAEDSGGQPHVRGEHTEITYVVDDIPLPDTLSGRQGSIVVPSTIESIDIMLGGYAPEFGGQTAAILNITTTPRPRQRASEMTLAGGTLGTYSGQITAQGPIGDKFGYVINLGDHRTNAVTDAQQPDHQSAHNAGSDQSIFTKFMLQQSARDRVTLTLSSSPDKSQVGNRTGLGAEFAQAGQGYGFLGLRNKDGSRPDVDASNSGLLGAANLILSDQDAAKMDINQKESNEFATLGWRHQISDKKVANVGFVVLHSGQDVTNNNPTVDVTNLPVDSSIEFNPTASRNIHHVQVNGSIAGREGAHSYKFGFVLDKQSGNESYQIVPASQLALDALAATAPNLAPAGATTGARDINGNPVYIATSTVSPILAVNRTGHYYAAFAQDTWKLGPRWTANYGARGDWYAQEQNLGQPSVNTFELSPRANMNYQVDRASQFRFSYNKLFNTPPLAQGAIVGLPLQPPLVNQYDVSYERQIDKYRTVKLAYYYKQIRDQIDVGLLIPGSMIGLYSGVNLQQGGVHGVEFSYDISAPRGIGWDSYFNYTMSAAKPKGVDNTGAAVGQFNDHDQRQAVGLGEAYTWKSGVSAALTLQHGSGLASSIVAPSISRSPRTEVGLHVGTGDRALHGRGGFGLDVDNLFDSRQVINFQSAFSGTRFQLGRRITLSANYKF